MRQFCFRPVAMATLAAMVTVGVSASAFAQNSTVIIAPSAPPAPQVETMPPPPPSSGTTMS